jgi:hypothetical protein
MSAKGGAIIQSVLLAGWELLFSVDTLTFLPSAIEGCNASSLSACAAQSDLLACAKVISSMLTSGDMSEGNNGLGFHITPATSVRKPHVYTRKQFISAYTEI